MGTFISPNTDTVKRMNVWVVIVKVDEIHARSVDKVFDSKEKAKKYVKDSK